MNEQAGWSASSERASAVRVALIALTFSFVGCSSTEAPPMPGGASGSSSLPPGGAGSGGAVAQGGMPSSTGTEIPNKALHRLSNVEYDNTLRDLTGTELRFHSSFVSEEVEGFDNIATALSVSPRQFEDYFVAARQVAADVFAKPALRDRIVTCSLGSGTSCVEDVIQAFGRRAFRRPLTTEERANLLKRYEAAVALGLESSAALQHVVHVVLSSPQFLYRAELDPTLGDVTPHRLDGYELASRLSYALWSSTPDDELLAQAESGGLANAEGVRVQVDRMLDDPRSETLVTNFAARWFGSRRLEEHVASTTLFPEYSAPLAASMRREMELYFSEFLRQDLPYSELLTADFNFVDAPLAAFYGVPPSGQPGMQRVVNASDQRVGLLGLAGFLTHTSRETRSSPIIRGNWVLDALLCTPLAVPAGLVVAPLEEPVEGDEPTTVRKQIEAHRVSPACSGCHNLIDPIGLALENFDAIGRFRAVYENGLNIDTAGVMPDGKQVNDLPSLAAALSTSAKFLPCAATKFGTYALGAALPEVNRDEIVARWVAGKPTLRSLIQETVAHAAFTSRRAEGL